MYLKKFFPLILPLVIPSSVMAIDIAGEDRKVLYIGVDGVQLEKMLATNPANFNQLTISKAYAGGVTDDITEQATYSGPGWATVLTGVWENKHNIPGNSSSERTSSDSLFSKIQDVHPLATQTSIASWGVIHDQFSDDMSSINFSIKKQNISDDTALTDALSSINQGVDFTFVHFSDPDNIAHGHGFGSNYNDALEKTDSQLGSLLSAVNARPSTENWLVIVVTDHGRSGSGHGHGGQSTQEKSIFIASNKARYHPAPSLSGSLYGGLPQTYGAAMISDFLSLNNAQEYYLKVAATGKWLNFTGENVKLYSANNVYDKTPWEFISTGVSNEFFLQNKWHCTEGDYRCNYWLSFEYQNISLYDTEYDKVPWEVVSDTTNPTGFYLKNNWRCEQDEYRCGQWLALDGDNAILTNDESLRTMFYKEKK